MGGAGCVSTLGQAGAAGGEFEHARAGAGA